MSGWNIIYGLINFAILAVGLYLVGKKIVVKMFADHRKAVEQELAQAGQSTAHAQSLLESIEQTNAEGETACDEIIDAARAAAEAGSRLEAENDTAEAALIAREAEKKLRRMRSDVRRDLSREASESIGAAAAAMVSRKRQRR